MLLRLLRPAASSDPRTSPSLATGSALRLRLPAFHAFLHTLHLFRNSSACASSVAPPGRIRSAARDLAHRFGTSSSLRPSFLARSIFSSSSQCALYQLALLIGQLRSGSSRTIFLQASHLAH